VVAVLSAVYAFVTPPVYTAQATLLPRPEESGQNLLLGQLVSLAGITLDQGGVFEVLYGRILTSDRILDAALSREWPDEIAGGEKTLLEILKPRQVADDEQEAALAADRFKRYLRRECISFSRDKSSGFMRLKVSLPRRPRLAADLANHLLERLDHFLGDASRSRAADQKRFIETRLLDVETELAAAEQRLSAFESENRSWAASPPLSMKHDELERDVRVQSTLWVELKRQLEIEKLDEHRDTVQIEVLDRAEPPLERSAPRRGLIILLGALLGCVLTGTVVLVRESGILA
jgi:uncharacterized protein involved in exopolysaccharide biosynthesis